MAPWALSSAHECIQGLTSAHSVLAPCSIVLKSTEECSIVLMSAHEQPSWPHELSWELTSGYEHPWVLICSHDRSYALLSMVPWHSEHSWALKRTQEHSLHHVNLFLTTPECAQMLMSAQECSRLLISPHDCQSAWLKKNTQNVNL